MLSFFKACVTRQNFPFRRTVSTASKYQPPFDPHRYTQGRWLDRDHERREARHLHFDFDALLDVAIESSPGARRVVHCEKKEGGFNRVFMIHLDNGCTVVARLPTRVAGPLSLAVSSEVATLQYVKEKTSIPVPSVLSWNADPNNKIGTEYMVLDAMPGVLLKDVWHNMKASEHIACIRSIGRLCQQLCRLSFPVYGSLYLNSEAPSGAVELDESFCIGPLCAPQHWNCGIRETASANPPVNHQGPWHNLEDYLSDTIARAKRSLLTTPEKSEVPHHDLLDLLQQTLDLVATTEMVKVASGPILSHPDLHTRNIFVDPEDHTKITGIIDWQSAAIEPAFVFAAETADFAEEVRGEEDDPKDISDEDKAANDRVRLDVEFCIKCWWVMRQTCKKLGPASRLDPTLLRALAAPSFGWTNTSAIIDTLLDNLAKKWTQLDLPGQSIYQHCEDEEGEQAQRLEDYQVKRRLQDHLANLLRCDSSDGWVSNDRWEEVLPLYRLEYNRLVETFAESDEYRNEVRAKVVEKADQVWPFDQR